MPSKKADMSNNSPQRQLSRIQETKRFVVLVDHQAKRSYDNREEADAEALRIKTEYPVVTVNVTDTEQDSLNMAKLAPGPDDKPREDSAEADDDDEA